MAVGGTGQLDGMAQGRSTAQRIIGLVSHVGQIEGQSWKVFAGLIWRRYSAHWCRPADDYLERINR